MPNIDGGHYFLTTFAPIRTEPMMGTAGNLVSPTASLRELLATLPSGAQSPFCDSSPQPSPFSRCRRTHLARFVVLDQPAFNGRDPGNAIVESALKKDLLVARPVDILPCSWLIFAADFDPGDAAAHDALADYLIQLWSLMGDELRAIYRHCHGFETIESGQDFARYIARCQIETTMPFNDYWTGGPPLPTISPAKIGAVSLAATALIAWGLVRILGLSLGWLGLTIPLAIGGVLYGAFRYITARGLRPFPTAPNSDLPTILKALYLQQRFAHFAVQSQSLDPQTLHAAFGDFVALQQPRDIAAPTQAPGMVRS
jgi:hypothetical protein